MIRTSLAQLRAGLQLLDDLDGVTVAVTLTSTSDGVVLFADDGTEHRLVLSPSDLSDEPRVLPAPPEREVSR